MTFVDIDYLAPTVGAVITRTREDSIVEGIVAARCGSSEHGKAWEAPIDLIDEQVTTMGSADIARLWLQDALYVFRCYGKTNIQADQLARRVIALWHMLHRDGPVDGTGGVRFRLGLLAAYNGPVTEPKSRQPVATVRMRIVSAGAPTT